MTRAAPALTVPEKDWQQTVLGLAARLRWERRYHTWNSMNSAKGWPDLVLVRVPRLVIVELKPDKVRARVTAAAVAQRPGWLAHRDLSDEQAAWLADLHAISVALADSIDPDKHAAAGSPTLEVYVWRPSDWPLVQQVLR